MVKHHVYFEALSTMESATPSWTATLAGLGVLSFVDAVRVDRTMADRDWTAVRVLAENVSSIREGDPVRRILLHVVEQLRGDFSWPAVNAALFAYGRALDLDGNWKLAADVFGTVADLARESREHELAIEATIALGGAARRSGDWDRSAAGYSEAAYLAEALGDKASGLTVRIGTANTEIARGNLKAAELILDEVVAEAEVSGLDGVAALALHGSGSVAQLKGNHSRAVSLAYKALEKTTNPTVKDTIMADLATSFFSLGMHAAARDAYLVVSATSRYQWVRWQAAINLMELASIDGQAEAFESYASQLKNQALDPRLRSYFLLFYGQGCRRFGRIEEAREYTAESKRFALANKIHQVAFEAERELTAVEKKARDDERQTTWTEAVPAEITSIAAELSRLRETALSSPTVDWS